MVISHQKKFIFSVIPKTASATLRHAIKDLTDIGWPHTKDAEHVPLHKAMSGEHASLFSSYTTFSFVRHPYDRLYSGYLQDIWASKNNDRWKEAKEELFLSIDYNFSQYLSKYVAQADLSNAWDWICFTPMHAFTSHGGYNIDFIGKYETFEDDVIYLSQILGVPEISISDDLNVRRTKGGTFKYLPFYTPDDVALVNELYDEDFRSFDYTKISPDAVG